jgi:hypothetical protein
MNIFKRSLSLILALGFLPVGLNAQSSRISGDDQQLSLIRQNAARNYSLLEQGPGGSSGGVGEFRVGYSPGTVMIPVNLWGATKVSGLFNVPKNTTLTTLLSYARGPDIDAKLTNVLIKRSSENKERVIKVDVEKILENPGTHDVILQPHDIVYVEAKKSIIDQRWVTVVAFVGTLLAATLSGVIIYDRTTR